MNIDFDRGFTLPGLLRGLCNRQAIQPGVFNGFTLTHRQVGQDQRQVFVGVAGGFVTFDRQGVGPIVNVVVQAFATTVCASTRPLRLSQSASVSAPRCSPASTQRSLITPSGTVL